MATTDFWVYNAENLSVSFFLPSYIHFSLTRGENPKKVFLGLPTVYIDSRVIRTSLRRDHRRHWAFNYLHFIEQMRGQIFDSIPKTIIHSWLLSNQRWPLIMSGGCQALFWWRTFFVEGGLMEFLLNYLLFPLIEPSVRLSSLNNPC